jgi:hypothetical protein
MAGKKKDNDSRSEMTNTSEAAELAAPTPGALDVLAVLWQQNRNQDRPLPLSEVHHLVCERRKHYGEPPAPLSTVSSTLQKLVSQGLVEGVGHSGAAASSQSMARPIRTRGAYQAPRRSSVKGYRPVYQPGEVLHSTFYGLAAAYPTEDRLSALLDFAKALGLPETILSKVVRLVEQEKPTPAARKPT